MSLDHLPLVQTNTAINPFFPILHSVIYLCIILMFNNLGISGTNLTLLASTLFIHAVYCFYFECKQTYQVFFQAGQWAIRLNDSIRGELIENRVHNEVRLILISGLIGKGFILVFSCKQTNQKVFIQIWEANCNKDFYRFVCLMYRFGIPSNDSKGL